MRFLSSVKTWTNKPRRFWHRAFLGALFLVIASGVIFVAAEPVWAQDGAPGLTAGQEVTRFANEPLTTLVLWLAAIIQYITGAIGQMMIVVIEIIIVPVLQYNEFSTSNVITLGWSLVRDIVNMFVVVILIIIAMGTIVGYSKVNWQQNLPQFLIAVILVNFSRTICGILIDISQVVMFTFVNALLDVAAGNFASLLGLQDYGLYSEQALKIDGSVKGTLIKAIGAAEQLGAAYMLFVLYASMFAIILLLALVFIYRIVVLWILVILSPIAFFLGGIKGISGAAAGASGQWWQKFTAALTLGPMLTFFLWLALAAAASGGVASGFAPPDEPTSYVLLQFQSDKLLSIFLGLILLVVGMQQAAASANSLGGVASSLINEKMGERIVSGAAKLPLRGAVKAGAFTAQQLDRRLPSRTGSVAGDIGQTFIQSGGDIGRRVGASLGGPQTFLGQAAQGNIARGFGAVGGSIQRRAEAQQAAEAKAATDRVNNLTDDQLTEHYRLIGAGLTSPWALNNRADNDAMMARIATNPALRGKMRRALGQEGLDRVMMNTLPEVEAKRDLLLDDAGRDKFDTGFKSENLHIVGRSAADAVTQNANESEADWRQRQNEAAQNAIRSHVRSNDFDPTKVRNEALADENVQAVFETETDRRVRTQETLADRFRSGKYRARYAPTIEDTNVETLTTGIQAGTLNLEGVTQQQYEANPALVQAVIGADAVRTLSDANRQAFAEAIDRLQPGAISLDQRAAADRALLETGSNPMMIGLAPLDINTGGALQPDMRNRMERMIESEPTVIRHLAPVMQTGTPNDVSRVVIQQIDAGTIQQLGNRIPTASDPQLQQIRQTLDQIELAIASESMRGGLTAQDAQRLTALENELRMARRYLP